MSKQSEAKEVQGYDPKPASRTCSNCKNYQCDKELPEWMQYRNDRAATESSILPYGENKKIDKNLRCGIGGFAVKKMATCELFAPKAEK